MPCRREWIWANPFCRGAGTSGCITVSTEYFRRDMQEETGEVKPYTRDFSGDIPADSLVLYTGEAVVCEGIAELEQAKALYGERLGIWWNYPVTDYMEEKLALGPVENLPRKGKIPAIFFNPMKHEELSKITLATGADYAKDPDAYSA